MNFLENINVARFLYSLQYMWQGMLSIFLVIGVLIGCVLLLNKITGHSNQKDKPNS